MPEGHSDRSGRGIPIFRHPTAQPLWDCQRAILIAGGEVSRYSATPLRSPSGEARRAILIAVGE
eukprot:12769541-Alexandrium_andersonii.AAC.1